MRTISYTPRPLWGREFDLFAELFARGGRVDRGPRYDVLRLDDQRYQVELAVPGYPEQGLHVSQDGDRLVVSGEPRVDDGGVVRFERGLDRGGFEHRFQLGPHTVVEAAHLDAGILRVDLAVRLPEELRSRRIQIGHAAAADNRKAA